VLSLRYAHYKNGGPSSKPPDSSPCKKNPPNLNAERRRASPPSSPSPPPSSPLSPLFSVCSPTEVLNFRQSYVLETGRVLGLSLARPSLPPFSSCRFGSKFVWSPPHRDRDGLFFSTALPTHCLHPPPPIVPTDPPHSHFCGRAAINLGSLVDCGAGRHRTERDKEASTTSDHHKSCVDTGCSSPFDVFSSGKGYILFKAFVANSFFKSYSKPSLRHN
jgi:hypothetical protein